MSSGGSVSPLALLIIYGGLVTLSCLAGGWALLALRLSHARLQMAISLVAGLMLGMAVLHFIPHAAGQLSGLEATMMWVLAGFLAMFFLQRFLPYHSHDVPEGEEGDGGRGTGGGHAGCGHSHAHSHNSQLAAPGAPKTYSWLATAVGMSLHSLTGGVALAAAVVSEAQVHGSVLVGLGTALAVILHKPFDAVTILTLMSAEGCSKSLRHLLNLIFALMTPIGMLLFYLGANAVADGNPLIMGASLAFCAGTFLCIACADLLPELQFHTHDRLKLSVALIAGLGIAIGIGHLGESHGHDHEAPAKAEQDAGAHDGHAH